MLASAEYFNMQGNSFSNVEKGTGLHDMVFNMTNWGLRKTLQWSGANGGARFDNLPEEIRFFKNLVELDCSLNSWTGELSSVSSLQVCYRLV